MSNGLDDFSFVKRGLELMAEGDVSFAAAIGSAGEPFEHTSERL